MAGICSTVEKRAKTMPDTIAETTNLVLVLVKGELMFYVTVNFPIN